MSVSSLSFMRLTKGTETQTRTKLDTSDTRVVRKVEEYQDEQEVSRGGGRQEGKGLAGRGRKEQRNEWKRSRKHKLRYDPRCKP